jgi:SnoaL-like domain
LAGSVLDRAGARDGTWKGRLGEATGPGTIPAMLEQTLDDNPPAPGPTLFHLNTGPAIEVDGDRATAALF